MGILCSCDRPWLFGVQGPTSPGAEPVTGLTATPISASEIELSWTNPNNGPVLFVVERSRFGAESFTRVAETSNDTLVDGELEANNHYTYRVQANSTGLSEPRTTSGWTLPATPSGVQVQTLSASALELTWQSDPDLRSYRLERRAESEVDFVLLAEQMTSDRTAYRDSDLEENSRYTYRLFALGEGGTSLPAEVTERTAFVPQLSWQEPNVQPGGWPDICRVVLPGVATIDQEKGAALAEATAAVTPRYTMEDLELDADADETGVVVIMEAGMRQPARLEVHWSVEDSFTSRSTIARLLGIDYPDPVTTTARALPLLSLGQDDMAGRQTWFVATGVEEPFSGPCRNCAGTRASLAISATSVCVVTSRHQVHCWGGNTHGQLGNGTLQARRYPRPVLRELEPPTPLMNVTAVAGGLDHFCALLEDGSVWCWGNNQDGRLGNGLMDEDELRAGPVCAQGERDADCEPLSDAVAVALGNQHSCALLANGQVRCWGANNVGQLGDGTRVAASAPTRVCSSGQWDGTDCAGGEILSGVIAIASGSGHSCALLSSNELRCWGGNDHGQLGIGNNHFISEIPLPVCRTGDASGGECEGESAEPLTGVHGVRAGGDNSCALMDGGQAYCWGNNTSLQLGNGLTDPGVPAPVCRLGQGPDCGGEPLDDVIALELGYWHACVLVQPTPGGPASPHCWGNNTSEQLGIGSGGLFEAVASPTPVCGVGSSGPCNEQEAHLGDVVTLVAGPQNSCAQTSDGLIHCWGANHFGQLGNTSLGQGANPTTVCQNGLGQLCEEGEVYREAAFRRCGDLAVSCVDEECAP